MRSYSRCAPAELLTHAPWPNTPIPKNPSGGILRVSDSEATPCCRRAALCSVVRVSPRRGRPCALATLTEVFPASDRRRVCRSPASWA
eukprot:scaffold12640_cov106-Isochrysis_galbana.AAC.11